MRAFFRRVLSENASKRTSQMIGETTEVDYRHLETLNALLDQLVALFAPAQRLMIEVLINIPGTAELLTLVIRPATSPAMYFHMRAGEGITGVVLRSGDAFAGAIQPET